MNEEKKGVFPLTDGTVYSRRKNFCPFSVAPLQAYASIVGEEKLERLQRVAQRLHGLKLLQINASWQGGGVSEMLHSFVPLLDAIGIESEWKVIRGNREYFECTKSLHNLLQGQIGTFTQDMRHCYIDNIEDSVNASLIDYTPDVVLAHDPQPLGLTHYLKKPGENWLWRCHIDIEEAALRANPTLWDFISDWTEHYDAAIFSAAHYVISRWPMPKFIIPPFIDPLSNKNRELGQQDIDAVLAKYQIDPKVPIIAQIGRFDPWKGIDRALTVYHMVKKEKKCQFVLAGGSAADDPEGENVLNWIYRETKDDEDIHVLNLPQADIEINALQRAANVIIQPSTREGFGLVITEALWKGKPVIAANIGGIPLQIREGDTGYFYQTPYDTAQKVLSLLENPGAAEELGKRGKEYVRQHFLIPDRIADCLMAIDMVVNQRVDKEICTECIISFHPWFKLTKRR